MNGIFVAMPRAILAVRRADPWEAKVVLSETTFRCIAADPGRPGRLLVGTTDRGLLLTDDAGASWRPTGDGIPQADITAVAVAEGGTSGSSVLYAGTEPSAVLRSVDGGGQWEELEGLLDLPSAGSWSFPPSPSTHHVRWIGPDPSTPGRIFVAIEAGALLRHEAGEGGWHDRVQGGPRDTHTLVVHQEIPGRLHSAAGDGYFESHDGGATWKQPQTGLGHRYVWGCAVDLDADVVLISAAASARRAHRAESAESHIYRKSADGPWEAVESGLPDPDGTTVSALAADPTEPGVVYAANNRGLFRSSDAGGSWDRLEIEWPGRFQEQRVAGIALVGSSS